MASPSKAEQPAEPALEVRGVSKSFGAVDVLTDISLTMREGDFLVLLGPSGCGKSTLLNCIAGLENVTGGTILINGRDVTQEPPRDRDIAMVFQSYALYPTMTVRENITFGMKVRGEPKDRQEAETRRVSDILQIAPLLNRKPSELSGGQRQRVAMGRALVRHPALFLFDEPLSNLDAKLRVEMRAEIKALHERVNASIVYVTHDQIEAMTMATRIVVLKDGIIQQVGTPDEVFNRPANTFVAGFMGSPPMNLVPVATEAQGDDLLLRFGEDPEAGLVLKGGAAVGNRTCLAGFRPESILATGEGSAEFGTPLEIVSVEKTGSDTFVHVSLGGAACTLRLPAHTTVAPGEVFHASIDPEAICFFDPQSGLRIEP